jgi:hypothetical protein
MFTFVSVCWVLWLCHNALLLSHDRRTLYKVIVEATRVFMDFFICHANHYSSNNAPPRIILWVPPPSGAHKLNTDDTMLSNLGRVGIDGNIQNEMGDFVCACAVELSKRATRPYSGRPPAVFGFSI